MTRTIEGIDGLKALVGEHLGYSPYVEITQEQVNTFAEATGDHQWIHVDVERANAGILPCRVGVGAVGGIPGVTRHCGDE